MPDLSNFDPQDLGPDLRNAAIDAGQTEYLTGDDAATAYVNAAIDCLQSGNCSKMDLLAAAAVAAGADPTMVAETQACLESGDDETCAKAATTVAAIAACSAATSGTATMGCTYVAPYV